MFLGFDMAVPNGLVAALRKWCQMDDETKNLLAGIVQELKRIECNHDPATTQSAMSLISCLLVTLADEQQQALDKTRLCTDRLIQHTNAVGASAEITEIGIRRIMRLAWALTILSAALLVATLFHEITRDHASTPQPHVQTQQP